MPIPPPPLYSPLLCDGIRACTPLLEAHVPGLVVGPLLDLASTRGCPSAADWPVIVDQFFQAVLAAEEVLALHLAHPDRLIIRQALYPLLRELAEAPREVTPASFARVLSGLDRTPLVTASGPFSRASDHLDALQVALSQQSRTPCPGVSAAEEAARQRHQRDLVDRAVRQFNEAAREGGPRQAPAAPASPTPAPTPGPLGGWGPLLLMAAVAGVSLYLGCSSAPGFPVK
jgi:hypothetical protein